MYIYHTDPLQRPEQQCGTLSALVWQSLTTHTQHTAGWEPMLLLLLLLLLRLMQSVPAGCMYGWVCMCVSECCNGGDGGDGWVGGAIGVCACALTEKVILSSANHNDRRSSSSIETEDNKERS